MLLPDCRAGRSGRSVTLVTQYDVEMFQKIEHLTEVRTPLQREERKKGGKRTCGAAMQRSCAWIEHLYLGREGGRKRGSVHGSCHARSGVGEKGKKKG